MKLKTVLFATFAALSITACTSQQTIPQLTAGVLQEVKDIEVYPDTTNNKAILTKFEDKCGSELTGNLKAGKVVEQWAFRDYTLITGGSATFALDDTSTATKFELHDAEVQKNFLALRNHFAKEALAQCN